MVVTQQQLFDALGVTPPEPETPASENTQEIAEPAAQTEEPMPDTGAKEQEPAAPAESIEEPDDKAESEKERNREFAAQRRRQEQQAAIDAALEEERRKNDERMAQFFKTAGLKNTLTGEDIKSLDDFYSWQDGWKTKQIEENLKKGKLTREDLDKVIAENPTVKQAQEIVAKNAQEAENARLAQAKAAAEKDIAEISKINPQITSLQDILNSDTAPQFIQYVNKGLSFKDAYYLANREAVDAKTAENARTQAMNNARSKEHLRTSKPAGAGNSPVPSDTMRSFRIFMPNATDAQIIEYYNKHKKG